MRVIFLVLLLLAAVNLPGQTIEGIVFDGDRSKLLPYAPLELRDSSSAIIIAGILTDQAGKYKFSNIAVGSYCIKLQYIGYKDSLFRNIEIAKDTILDLDIHRFCIYDASLNDKTCPYCNKQNRVIPILYGFLLHDASKKDGKTFKSGGCNISQCDPHWYCKRDKIEF